MRPKSKRQIIGGGTPWRGVDTRSNLQKLKVPEITPLCRRQTSQLKHHCSVSLEFLKIDTLLHRSKLNISSCSIHGMEKKKRIKSSCSYHLENIMGMSFRILLYNPDFSQNYLTVRRQMFTWQKSIYIAETSAQIAKKYISFSLQQRARAGAPSRKFPAEKA